MAKLRLFRKKPHINKELFALVVSGSQSGIATTAAIIIALSLGAQDRDLILLSATVAVLVQAFNTAITTVLTSHTIDEVEQNRDMNSYLRPVREAGLQFIAHVGLGGLLIVPTVYVESTILLVISTLLLAMLLLLWAGVIIGHIVHSAPWRHGIQSVSLGLVVIIVGMIAGVAIR